MATYKGNDIASPDRLDADLLLVGKRLGGLENVEEELNLPPSAEPDALRRPGQKGYMETQPMAAANPERQARLAARREQMANDPTLRDAQENANAAVLGKYEQPTAQPITPAAPAPRPMLPNFYAQGGTVDKLRDTVDRNTNQQGLELISRDLDKPQLMRPSSDQYMREHGYPNRSDVPKFSQGGKVKHGSSTHVTCRSKHG